jgi:hypothetical protein
MEEFQKVEVNRVTGKPLRLCLAEMQSINIWPPFSKSSWYGRKRARQLVVRIGRYICEGTGRSESQNRLPP